MNAGTGELPVIYLKAGDMHVTDKPSVVITVLGSCLSITMHSRRLGAGGICHGLMPVCKNAKQCPGSCEGDFKYVDCSIRMMVKLFERWGATRSEIEVKCFGGADMFSRDVASRGAVSVGWKNIQTARDILMQEGLTPVAADVGGNEGRKIFFYPHTGEILLKRLCHTGHPKSRL